MVNPTLGLPLDAGRVDGANEKINTHTHPAQLFSGNFKNAPSSPLGWRKIVHIEGGVGWKSQTLGTGLVKFRATNSLFRCRVYIMASRRMGQFSVRKGNAFTVAELLIRISESTLLASIPYPLPLCFCCFLCPGCRHARFFCPLAVNGSVCCLLFYQEDGTLWAYGRDLF